MSSGRTTKFTTVTKDTIEKKGVVVFVNIVIFVVPGL